MVMVDNYETKMDYLEKVINPGLAEAFKRGDKKYTGKQHYLHPRIISRHPSEDIRHVRDCHAGVRLREAEDAADGEDLGLALEKIESAIGFLIILHMRINDRKEAYIKK